MYRSIGLSFLNLIPPPSRLSIGGCYPAHIYVSITLYSLDAALLGDSFRQGGLAKFGLRLLCFPVYLRAITKQVSISAMSSDS